MRTAAYTLTATLVFAVSLLASNETVQPSYDALMAMPAAERQATLAAMGQPARLTMFRTHIDRWLEQNRGRLSANQVGLVTEVRDSLMSAQRDLDAQRALEQRMRCELWRSDVIALSLPHRDSMSSTTLSDVGHWLRECVVAKGIDVVF
jgi:putative exporter of polyketide antibiotics